MLKESSHRGRRGRRDDLIEEGGGGEEKGKEKGIPVSEGFRKKGLPIIVYRKGGGEIVRKPSRFILAGLYSEERRKRGEGESGGRVRGVLICNRNRGGKWSIILKIERKKAGIRLPSPKFGEKK